MTTVRRQDQPAGSRQRTDSKDEKRRPNTSGSRLALIRFVKQMQATFGIAPQHTVIAGFSQGGILSFSVALSAPERVAGFGVLSGRILPELEPR